MLLAKTYSTQIVHGPSTSRPPQYSMHRCRPSSTAPHPTTCHRTHTHYTIMYTVNTVPSQMSTVQARSVFAVAAAAHGSHPLCIIIIINIQHKHTRRLACRRCRPDCMHFDIHNATRRASHWQRTCAASRDTVMSSPNTHTRPTSHRITRACTHACMSAIACISLGNVCPLLLPLPPLLLVCSCLCVSGGCNRESQNKHNTHTVCSTPVPESMVYFKCTHSKPGPARSTFSVSCCVYRSNCVRVQTCIRHRQRQHSRPNWYARRGTNTHPLWTLARARRGRCAVPDEDWSGSAYRFGAKPARY